MTTIAAKACIPCRDRKRKCDRTLPSCSLCYRLGRRCHYEPRIYVSSTKSNGSATKSRSSTPDHESNSLCSATTFTSTTFLKSSINNAITENLKLVVGDVSAIRTAAATYFRSVHSWFPIISDVAYYEQLPTILLDARADYSLLSLSMALIIMVPPAEATSDDFWSLYRLVKSSIAVAEASDINSLEVVQSRLLLSLFEVGHSIEPAAYISIAATARAAATLGLNRMTRASCSNEEACRTTSSVQFRVWWAIVMLDRNYTLERGQGPLATQGLGSPHLLPRDGSIWDKKVLTPPEPLALSTPSCVRVGPFARQAQVSHVLDILMMHLYEHDMNQPIDLEESNQIARTLTAFSLLLPEETPQPWPRYCGAVGMCYGALMTLFEHRPESAVSHDTAGSYAPESLEGALDRICHISRVFNAKVNEVDVEVISPFPPYGLAKAASIQETLWRRTGNPKYLKGSDDLKQMISLFAKRWMGGSKHLSRLQKERKSYV